MDEDVPVNWQLTDLTCVSGDGDSTTTTTGTLATIDLAAGDTVTCTYTDAPLPPAALTIEKVSYGGVGTFPFTITGGQAPVDVSATTTVPGVAVDTGPTTLSDPGQYTITEDLPTATGGAWTLTSVTCDGTDETPVDDAVTITVAQGDEPVCTFTDTFDPDGVIAISKVMNGALGDADFVIGSDAFPGQSLYQTASPTAEGVPALATGDASDQLPLGTYSIEELVPSGGDPTGWSLDDVTCNGSTTPVTAGVVTVTLTAAEPTADCTFTDSYSAPVPPTTTTTSTTTAPTTTTTAPATLPAAPEAPIAGEVHDEPALGEVPGSVDRAGDPVDVPPGDDRVDPPGLRRLEDHERRPDHHLPRGRGRVPVRLTVPRPLLLEHAVEHQVLGPGRAVVEPDRAPEEGLDLHRTPGQHGPRRVGQGTGGEELAHPGEVGGVDPLAVGAEQVADPVGVAQHGSRRYRALQ